MPAPPETRRAALAGDPASQKVDGNSNVYISEPVALLQEFRAGKLRRRFAMSAAVALTICEHAFHTEATR